MPVTLCVVATVEVHTAPVQEPPPAIVKTVSAVTSPMGLPYWSRLVATDGTIIRYFVPAAMVAALGLIAMEETPVFATTTSVAPALILVPLTVPVTV